MRLSCVLLAVILATTPALALDSCTKDLQDREKRVDIVVEACENIGTYSVGGLYDGEFQKLTFQYPEPWQGTFTTFNIDGRYYCTSKDPKNCIQTDEYTTVEPTVKGDTIAVDWSLDNITVEQRHKVVENKTVIQYLIRNTDTKKHKVAVRLHIDTMLGVNDGAPIYVPGDGLKTTEKEYEGENLNFEYWKAYNRPDEPTIVATGTIDPKLGMTYPSKVVIADWKRSKDTAWEYAPEGRVITGDSAVLLYYELGVIEPGGEKTVEMGYGNEPPVLKKEQGELGVTEITLSSVSGEYCPGDTVNFKVDVLNTVAPRSGEVALIVEYNETEYYNNKAPATFPTNQVKTMEYSWVIPPQGENRAYTVKAVLYNATGVVELKTKADAIKVDGEKCRSTIVKVGAEVVGGLLFMILFGILGLIGAAGAYLWYNRGSVEFTKYVDGENVTVRVLNKTPRIMKNVILEDAIPTGAEIRIHTLHALRKQNAIVWETGNIMPNEDATLEYTVKGGHAVSQASLRWDKGSKNLM